MTSMQRICCSSSSGNATSVLTLLWSPESKLSHHPALLVCFLWILWIYPPPLWAVFGHVTRPALCHTLLLFTEKWLVMIGSQPVLMTQSSFSVTFFIYVLTLISADSPTSGRCSRCTRCRYGERLMRGHGCHSSAGELTASNPPTAMNVDRRPALVGDDVPSERGGRGSETDGLTSVLWRLYCGWRADYVHVL